MADDIYPNQRWTSSDGVGQWVVLRLEGDKVVLQSWNAAGFRWGNEFLTTTALDLQMDFDPTGPLTLESFEGEEVDMDADGAEPWKL